MTAEQKIIKNKIDLLKLAFELQGRLICLSEERAAKPPGLIYLPDSFN